VKSIRLYLIIVLLSTICLVNFLAAVQGYRRSMVEASQLLDEQLAEDARLVSRLAAAGGNLPRDMYSDSMVFQVWRSNRLLHRSNNAPETSLSPMASGYHMQSYRGLRWRLLVYEDDDPQFRVIVGQRADVYARLVENIIVESLLPIIWVLPILGLVIWLIVSFGLSPLKRLAVLLRQRRAEDLTPLDVSGYPVELAIVVSSTNQLLSRLAAAFDREKRFAADAAHELRTPLAALKVNLRNLTDDIGADNDSVRELEASVDRMGHSIEQILTLYRLTPETLHRQKTAVDLQGLAKKVIIELYRNFQGRHQDIELQSEPVVIEADEFALMTLMRNLVDNAGKYTPPGGRVLVVVKPEGQNALVRVEDSGPGIAEAHHSRVFDRFYRVGGDRHDSNVIGCGLGLSIVDHIVRLHQGQIDLGRSAALGGLAVAVRLPLPEDPGHQKGHGTKKSAVSRTEDSHPAHGNTEAKIANENFSSENIPSKKGPGTNRRGKKERGGDRPTKTGVGKPSYRHDKRRASL